MSRIEVLCATMHQTNIDLKYKQMNIKTDVVFANQADRFAYEEKEIDGNSVKVITTKYRGVGNNRNFALLNATSEICMIADDDIVYENEYAERVSEAYDLTPDADVIVFNCKRSKKTKEIKKVKRVRFWNFMRYGAVSITARTDSLKRSHIMFSQMFGGGSPYCSGEDNLFMKDIIFKRLKVYAYPSYIATINDERSTWFEGYTKKYFFDHGAWLEAAFPLLKYILALYFFLIFKRRRIGRDENTLYLMLSGIKGYQKAMTYEQWDGKNI